jgi:hypothetical protein
MSKSIARRIADLASGLDNSENLTLSGSVTASSFTGDGSTLSNIATGQDTDGGFANSTYTSAQSVDGGSASG